MGKKKPQKVSLLVYREVSLSQTHANSDREQKELQRTTTCRAFTNIRPSPRYFIYTGIFTLFSSLMIQMLL